MANPNNKGNGFVWSMVRSRYPVSAQIYLSKQRPRLMSVKRRLLQLVSAPGCTQTIAVDTCDLGGLVDGGVKSNQIIVEAVHDGVAINTAQVMSFSFDDDASDNSSTTSTNILPAKQKSYLPVIQK